MDLKRLKFNTIHSKISGGLFLLLLLIIPGCDIIGGIFQTGVGVGAFIVIVVVLLILALVVRGRRR